MTSRPEIARRAISGVWRTDVENEGGSNGGSQAAWEEITVPTDAASWDALGNAIFVPATILADVAPTLPVIIVPATNDQFAFNFSEVFTVAPGVYTTVAQCVAAMAAATGSGSGERWDTIATPSNSSGSILLTAVTAVNDDAITDSDGGNGAAAALGFTGNPDRFADGNGGAWLFADDVITSTTHASGDPVIVTTVDNFGQAWAVEFDAKVADNSSYQIAFNAGAWLYQAATAQELDGSGFYVSNSLGGPAADFYNQSPQISDTTIPDTDWHTYRAVNLPLVQEIYFESVLVGRGFGFPNFQAPSDGLKESRFLLFDGIGGTQFRNLNAWRIPLPVFP